MAFPFETIVSKPNEWKFSLKWHQRPSMRLTNWLPHKGTRSYARRPTTLNSNPLKHAGQWSRIRLLEKASSPWRICWSNLMMPSHIGKYLSSLRKLDHVIAPKEGFETQLQASRLSIPFGMRALGMTRQICDGLPQRGIEPRLVPALQGPDNGT